MPTIKDIAQKAQVSTCAVSRYLNNKIKLKAETEERIKAAIKELGYIPNSVAKSLKTKTTQNIALILPTINNLFFSEIAAGVSSILDDHDYSLFIFESYNESGREAKIARKVLENRLAGAIFVALPHDSEDDSHLNALVTSRVPVVLTNRSFVPQNHPLVFSDFRLGGHQAAEHLLSQGYKNIGIITGYHNHLESELRVHSFLETLLRAGVSVEQQKILECKFERDLAGEAAKELLDKRVEAIFAISDLMAVGAMKSLKQNRARIPDDVAVVGFGNTLFSRLTTPEMTTIDLQNFQLGVRSAVNILGLINDTNVELVTTLSTHLVKRGSTCKDESISVGFTSGVIKT